MEFYDKNIAINEILEAGKRMYQKGFVASNDGNISAKISENEILITATGVCKGDMTKEHILTVDINGNLISGAFKPTSEMKLHIAIYKERADVFGVVHAHPQVATAFAVARKGLDKVSLSEVVLSLGKVSLADYGTPSTEDLPNTVIKHVHDGEAVLMSNHGAVTYGKSVMDAYFNMETLEHFAKISLNARILGGEHFFNQKETDKLFDVRKKVFGKK